MDDTTMRITVDRLKRFAVGWNATSRPSAFWNLEVQVPLEWSGKYPSFLLTWQRLRGEGYYSRHVFDDDRGALIGTQSKELTWKLLVHTVEGMRHDIMEMLEVERRGANPDR